MRVVPRAAHGGAPVRHVLDLGCGTGRFANGLARAFDAHVLGIDPSTRRLPDADIEAGLDRLCTSAHTVDPLPVTVPIDSFVFG